MNEYHFGLANGHLPKKADTIAKKHGAWLVNYTEPDGFKRHWFSCRNYGEPFDSQCSRMVMNELIKKGIIKEVKTCPNSD